MRDSWISLKRQQKELARRIQKAQLERAKSISNADDKWTTYYNQDIVNSRYQLAKCEGQLKNKKRNLKLALAMLVFFVAVGSIFAILSPTQISGFATSPGLNETVNVSGTNLTANVSLENITHGNNTLTNITDSGGIDANTTESPPNNTFVNETELNTTLQNLTSGNISIDNTTSGNITDSNVTIKDSLNATEVNATTTNETGADETIEVVGLQNETDPMVDILEALAISSDNLTEPTAENLTNENNETKEIETVSIAIAEEEMQYSAEILKPVKWKKTVYADSEISNLTISLPEDSTIVSVVEIEEGQPVVIPNDKIKEVKNSLASVSLSNNLSNSSTQTDELSSITGGSVLKQSSIWTRIINFFKGLVSITGASVTEESEPGTSDMKIVINDNVTQVEIEYLTDAPQVKSKESFGKKRVTIYSDYHYKNILAYTSIPETLADSVAVYWIINDSRQKVNATAEDTNNNGMADKVKWIVPHLSNQTFEIELLNATGVMDMLVYRGGLSYSCEDGHDDDEHNEENEHNGHDDDGHDGNHNEHDDNDECEDGNGANPRIPIFRRHNITEFSIEGSALDVGGDIEYTKVVANPSQYSDEKVLCTRDNKQDLNCQVWGGAWANLEELTKKNGAEKNFDVVYQEQTGDAWVCYRDGADKSVPYCNVWNGTSWDTEADALDVGKTIKALKLFADPNSGYIALMTKDSGKDINVQIWNGTSWSNLIEVETHSSTCDRCLSFDGAWESSGNFVAIWFDKSDEELESRAFSKTSGWSAQKNAVITNLAKNAVNVIADSNPNAGNNEIVVAVNDADGKLAVNNWDGNNWGTESVLDSNIGDAKNYNHLFYLAYEQKSEYQAIVTYGKDKDEQHYNLWTPSNGTWSQQLDLPDGSDERVWFQLASDSNSNNLMLTALSKDGNVETIEWDGSSWDLDWLNHESESDKHYWNAWFTYDYEDEEGTVDITPPDINLIAPANNSEDFNGFIRFMFNVTDESPVVSCSLILNSITNQTIVPSGTNNEFDLNLTNANYTWSIECTDQAGNVGYSEERVVEVAIPPNVPDGITVTETINTANDTNIYATVEYIDAGSNQVDYNRTGLERNATLEPGLYNIRITPDNTTVQEVLISGANLTSNNVTKLINLDVAQNTSQFESALYAVDPSNTSFDYNNITFTVQASGRALYKCTNWSYSTQTCIDNRWKKIRTIVPGENYTVTMFNATDPGFGEDNKTISVLDRYDYLVNNTQTILGTYKDVENVNITYIDSVIDNMIVYHHNLSAYLDNLHLDNPADGQNFTKLYAINASDLAFESANVTVIANESASVLVKCDEWRFMAQNCTTGDWYTLDREINGSYAFKVNLTDPGFAEVVSGPANISDSYMKEKKPNKNYGASKNLKVGGKTSQGKRYRSIIWFNLSNIPANAVINGAQLQLYIKEAEHITGSTTNTIHRIQQSPERDWKELEVTWDDYNDSGAWTSSGGDYNATPTDSVMITNSMGNSYINFTVTSDAQNFVHNASTNFGWLIKDSAESTKAEIEYRSSEHKIIDQRPRLFINYTLNNIPYIGYVEPVINQNPTESSVTTVNISFLATDLDGVADLNDSSAFAQFNKTGETVRSSGCSWIADINSTTANYTCSVGMQYFDAPGNWTINVSISDGLGLTAENSTTNFIYNQLVAITMSPDNLTWPTLNLTSTNVTSNNDPTLINNTGNANDNVSVKAFDLHGLSVLYHKLNAENFTVSISAGNPCAGTFMANGTSNTIGGATLPRGNYSINDGNTGQEQLYYCLANINNSISQQPYSTSLLGPWVISASPV